MHRMHNEPKTKDGPQTTGSTIHWAAEYDFFMNLLGMGTNRANSRMVVELAGIQPGERVLDVGCGTGRLTLTARAYTGPGGAVYGIDAAPEMIEVARRNAERSSLDAVFEVGLIEDIPFPATSFDAVINRLVIHHLPDELKRKGFAEILRVLKPGGRLLIADFTPPRNPVLNHITSALVGSHMMESNIGVLPAMLEQAGFVQVISGPTRSSFLGYVSGKKANG
jgi:ubiquinone/menaquinone biosynthesis C-methylase UbiE